MRNSVATLAWAAVMAGELAPFGIAADEMAGIHVVVSTSTEFDAEWLTASVANNAA